MTLTRRGCLEVINLFLVGEVMELINIRATSWNTEMTGLLRMLDRAWKATSLKEAEEEFFVNVFCVPKVGFNLSKSL